MGYFDGLAEATFKSDGKGNRLFYKWGVFGNAYILPDKQKEDEIKNFMILFYKVVLSSILGVGIIFNWFYAFIIAVPLSIWFIITITLLTTGLSISTEKLSFKESYANSAKRYSKTMLWLMLVASLIFMLGGVYIIARSEDDVDMLIGLSIILLFGGSFAVYIYMLLKKRT